jgi:hypothetical protein
MNARGTGWLAAIVVTLGFLGSAARESLAQGRCNGQPINVSITMSVHGADRPIFSGTTNLPDGFQALASFEASGRIYAQDKIVVQFGNYSIGPLRLAGGPFHPGPYTISIDSPLTELQPASVRQLIGPGGACLAGPFTIPLILGGRDMGERGVHFKATTDIQ